MVDDELFGCGKYDQMRKYMIRGHLKAIFQPLISLSHEEKGRIKVQGR